jgi:hypothetical protein
MKLESNYNHESRTMPPPLMARADEASSKRDVTAVATTPACERLN